MFKSDHDWHTNSFIKMQDRSSAPVITGYYVILENLVILPTLLIYIKHNINEH